MQLMNETFGHYRRSAWDNYFVLEQRQADLADRPNQTQTNNSASFAFDRHIDYIKNNPSIWLLPMGILAVGLKFNKPITEYVDLVKGLLGNIINSILSEYIPILCFCGKATFITYNGSCQKTKCILHTLPTGTFSAAIQPATNLLSPITNYILGPMDSFVPVFRLDPLFKPFRMCPSSPELSPFTITIQKEKDISSVISSGSIATITGIANSIPDAVVSLGAGRGKHCFLHL